MSDEQFLTWIEKFSDKRYKKENLIRSLFNKIPQTEALKKAIVILDNPESYTPKQVYGSSILVKSI